MQQQQQQQQRQPSQPQSLAPSDDQIQDLYAWIDEIPLSRPKRNISRDFSDAVLAAEVIKYHIPRLVDIHNYPPANSLSQKQYNWNTLAQKVLKKLRVFLDEGQLDGLANAKAGYIEHVLLQIRRKIFLFQQQGQQQGQSQRSSRQGFQSQGSRIIYPSYEQPLQQQEYGAGGGTMAYYAPPMQPMIMLSPPQMYAPYQPQPPKMQSQVFQHLPSLNQMALTQQTQMQEMHQQPVEIPQKQRAPPRRNSLKQLRIQQSQQPQPLEAEDDQIPSYSSGAQRRRQFSNSQEISTLTLKIHQKQTEITELGETVEILSVKVQKLEQLLALKDKKIQELTSNKSF